MSLPGDGNRHRSHHQNDYGTHCRLQIGLRPHNTSLVEERGKRGEDT